MLRGYLTSFFWSLNFHNSSLITHNSSLITHHSNFHIHLPSSSNFYHSIFFTLFIDPTTVTVSDHFCFVTRIPFSSPINISLFLISPSPSALSLSQSRNPNPEKCLNLPRLVSTIIIGEQRPSLRCVQRPNLAVMTHFPTTPTRKPKPIKISFSPRQDHHHS